MVLKHAYMKMRRTIYPKSVHAVVKSALKSGLCRGVILWHIMKVVFVDLYRPG